MAVSPDFTDLTIRHCGPVAAFAAGPVASTAMASAAATAAPAAGILAAILVARVRDMNSSLSQ
jgi:hypothetical protein